MRQTHRNCLLSRGRLSTAQFLCMYKKIRLACLRCSYTTDLEITLVFKMIPDSKLVPALPPSPQNNIFMLHTPCSLLCKVYGLASRIRPGNSSCSPPRPTHYG